MGHNRFGGRLYMHSSAATQRKSGASILVIRQPKAYPVYDAEYQDALEIVGEWIRSFENFQTVGRDGLHRYNNQDHAMLGCPERVRRESRRVGGTRRPRLP